MARAPVSSARFAKVCLKLWNVLFSSVRPARGISAAAIAGYRCRRSTTVGERNGWPFMPGKTRPSIEQLWLPPLIGQERDDVGDEVDVSPFAILRRSDHPARVA